jgi:hypothetical protein
LEPVIGKGLLRREPSIDFRFAAEAFPDGIPDSEVFRIAAEDWRVVVSRDVRTMPGHFDRFIAQQDSPGIVLIPYGRSIGDIIVSLASIRS